MILAHGLACVAGVLAAMGLLYALVAAVVLARFLPRRTATASTCPPVTLLKPLHGADAGLAADLAGFCTQDYPGPVQIVFGSRSPSDPAIAVVEALRLAYPDVHIELVIDPRQHGSNRKISNVVNMAARARHDLIVVADSDIGVAPDYLRRVVGALEAPGVGLVTTLYRGCTSDNIWSRLAGADMDRRFMPGVALSHALGLGHPCLGPTMALRRSTLELIGGFQSVGDHLADDHELGRLVRQAGLRIAFAGTVTRHACPETSLRALFTHELRWARTIRLIQPAGHAATVVTYPLPAALACWTLSGLSSAGLLLVLAALSGQLALAVTADRSLGRRSDDLWLSPIRDLLSFAVFTASFLGRTVCWRETRFRVAANGALSEA